MKPNRQVLLYGNSLILGAIGASLRLENYTSSPPTGAVLNISVQTVIGGLLSGEQIGIGTIPLNAMITTD